MENYTKEDLFNLSLDNKVKLINYVMLFTDSDYICANGAALDTNNIKSENFSDKSDFLPFGFSQRSDNSSFNIKANCFMWTDLIDDHDLSKFLLPEQVNKFLEIADNGWSEATAEIESDSEIFKLSQDQCNKLCNILLENFNDSQNKIKSVLSDGYNVLKDSYTPSIYERQLKSIQSYNQELTGADLNHYITENFHFITPEQQIFTECPMPGKNQTSGDTELKDDCYVNPVSDPKSVYFEGAKYNTDFIQYNGEYIDDYGVWKVPLSELNSVREPSMLDKICYRSLDDVEACSRMSKNELFKLIIDQAKQNTQSQTQDRSFHL